MGQSCARCVKGHTEQWLVSKLARVSPYQAVCYGGTQQEAEVGGGLKMRRIGLLEQVNMTYLLFFKIILTCWHQVHANMQPLGGRALTPSGRIVACNSTNSKQWLKKISHQSHVHKPRPTSCHSKPLKGLGGAGTKGLSLKFYWDLMTSQSSRTLIGLR